MKNIEVEQQSNHLKKTHQLSNVHQITNIYNYVQI